MTYLQSNDNASAATGRLRGGGCIFCDKPSENHDAENLIVQRGQTAYVILNLYPYNNGHLMVVPYAHVPSPEQLEAVTLTEIMALMNQGITVLRTLYSPQAFNVGMNIGMAAGAGIAGHVHLHVVPRWAGDTNFMTVAAETRVIPEDLTTTWQRMKNAWPRM